MNGLQKIMNYKSYTFLCVILLALFGCNDSTESNETLDDIVPTTVQLREDKEVTKFNTSVGIPVLENDSGVPSSYELLVDQLSVENGRLNILNNSIVMYTPNKAYIGVDSFYYYVKVDDIKYKSLVTVKVEPLRVVSFKLPTTLLVENEPTKFDIKFDGILTSPLNLELRSSSLNFNIQSVDFTNANAEVKFTANDEKDFVRGMAVTIDVIFPYWIESSSQQFRVNYYSKPSMKKLNWPQRTIFTRDSLKTLLLDENKINFYWLNFGTWQVPDNPTWNENPYGNISWQLFYHSLGWLTTYGEVYKDTKDKKWLDKICNYLIDYNKTYPNTELTEPLIAYREDAVALRVNHLLYFYLNFYHEFDSETQLALEQLIDKDWNMLQRYINDSTYDDDNHGLIQAKSALNLYSVFSYFEQASEMLHTALSRLNKASALMFDGVNGQNIEQAFEYHFTGVSMLLEAKIQLDNLEISSPSVLLSTLRKAIVKGAYLLNDDGTTPAIGDSYSNKNFLGYLKGYYIRFKEVIPEFESFLKLGQTALDPLNVSEAEGLVIAKVNSNIGTTKAYFDAGPLRIVHGHFDNLNLVYTYKGDDLLVDSGGPFTYENPGRKNFWSLSSHNTLVLDGVESNLFPAQLTQVENKESFLLFSGIQPGKNSSMHKRAVTLTKAESPILIIVDFASGASKYEENWHYANGSAIEIKSSTESIISLRNDKKFKQLSWSESNDVCKIEVGVLDNFGVPIQGWVTEGYNTAIPAPVKECISTAPSYLKVNAFFSEMEYVLTVNKIDQIHLQIQIGQESFIYNIRTNQLQ